MRVVSVFVFFLFLNFLSHHMAENTTACGTFRCGNQVLKFPFFQSTMASRCGLFKMNCTAEIPEIQLVENGRWYEVTSVSQTNAITITDPRLNQSLTSGNCTDLSRFSFPDFPWLENLTTLYKCNSTNNEKSVSNFRFTYQNCREESFYYTNTSTPGCSAIRAPEIWIPSNTNSTNLRATFSLHISLPRGCFSCHYDGGECKIIHGKYQCVGEPNDRKMIKLGLGIGGSILLLIILVVLFIILRRVYRRETDSELLSRGNSKAGVEYSHVFFQVPIFSYKELQEATKNFSKDRLLGDGGFGTVYYGKVQDGREVAVKRLYEHNYRRVEQFMNEIEILTRLHHKNLVSLYGCTSRRSRELLLVYEFIPNGTVADHLHGDPPKPDYLTWPMRMNIAIETASALAYLHASDIIHRDVKTANILLDSNFSVKVADFGLSRLFPTDVTHVSTAPQGTPGYVDPEYHQCYHLTDKSDVFSFGVVLVELISSKPAVDINRCKSEINLSSLAIKKIQNHATHELIDQNLGYNTDEEVRKMTTMVAELAFQCLQQDNAMRPTMEQVVQELKGIQKKDFEASPSNGDEACLLKNMKYPLSPISVTHEWTSKSTTPNTSA